MEEDSTISQRQKVYLRDHVSLEIKEEDESFVSSIKEKMESVSLSQCICRVPERFFNENEENYFPKLVSIGPFHHSKDDLKPMEDQKWRYLHMLLSRKPKLEARLDTRVSRKPKLETSLDTCVKALRELEHKARKCYGEKINQESDEFVKMMLVDGCFIIELFLNYSNKGLRRRDDPFFNTKETFFRLRCDLILLENQIPFFILNCLFSLIPIPKQCTNSLSELALNFFKKIIPGHVQILQENYSQDFNHLLDFVRHFYLPTSPKLQSCGAQQRLDCAMNLHEIIGFEKAISESILDIKFVDGILKIPPLKFHIYTEILFRNLVAMENCYLGSTKHITSYAMFMESLIQSKEDVRLLYRRRILTNGLEQTEEIINLFKKLHMELNVEDFYYNGVCEKVNDRYGKNKWKIWCKKMKESYRKTPIAVAGFILAILFLVLTFTGTLVSVLSFSFHHF